VPLKRSARAASPSASERAHGGQAVPARQLPIPLGVRNRSNASETTGSEQRVGALHNL